jgi:hypothetical protein
VTDDEYITRELTKAMEPGAPVKIKAMGPGGESRWVTVGPEKFARILDLFQDEN